MFYFETSTPFMLGFIYFLPYVVKNAKPQNKQCLQRYQIFDDENLSLTSAK